MSPTSYQAAPPRIATIADEPVRVKWQGIQKRLFSSEVIAMQSHFCEWNGWATTTRCRECRREPSCWNSSAHLPCPWWSGRGSGPRCRIAAPNPWLWSWGRLAQSEGSRPAANHQQIAEQLVCPKCNCRWRRGSCEGRFSIPLHWNVGLCGHSELLL